MSTARSVAAYALVPCGAIAIGWLVFGETASALICGGALSVAGVVAVTLAEGASLRRRVGTAARAVRALARGEQPEAERLEGTDLERLSFAIGDASALLDATTRGLRQERAQLDSLLNASNDAIVAIDGDGAVVYVNDAALAMFLSERPIGRPFIELVRDHDLYDLMIAAARQGERSVRVVAYGPSQRWLQATALRIEDAGDWAALAVFHDLTEVRKLDSVRRDFISNVSHELRTPLAGIRAAAETLQEGAIDDRPAATEFLGHIQRETDRMTQLVEELLELSRIESGAAPLNFNQFDVDALVSATTRRFAQQAERAGLSIARESGGEPLLVTGDEERLERALSNLVANAIKFTPPGGRVTLEAGAEPEWVTVMVTDTGPGIEIDQQARIFERFYKADRSRGGGGIGLGLAIAKHIVQAHDGSIAVESRPGRGSRFTVRLPRH